MVLERAQFRITPGREDEFETAFEQARLVLAAAQGFISATLSRRVVIALLEASEDPRFDAVGVDIALSPLPTATFRLAPHVPDPPSGLPAPAGGRASHGP